MIRTFMRTFFPVLLDVAFVLGLLFVLFSSFSMARSGFGGFSLITALTTLIGGIGALILSFGAVYLLLDIRDLLEKNSK